MKSSANPIYMQICPPWKIFNHSPKWSFTGNFKGASVVLIVDSKICPQIRLSNNRKSYRNYTGLK